MSPIGLAMDWWLYTMLGTVQSDLADLMEPLTATILSLNAGVLPDELL